MFRSGLGKVAFCCRFAVFDSSVTQSEDGEVDERIIFRIRNGS